MTAAHSFTAFPPGPGRLEASAAQVLALQDAFLAEAALRGFTRIDVIPSPAEARPASPFDQVTEAIVRKGLARNTADLKFVFPGATQSDDGAACRTLEVAWYREKSAGADVEALALLAAVLRRLGAPGALEVAEALPDDDHREEFLAGLKELGIPHTTRPGGRGVELRVRGAVVGHLQRRDEASRAGGGPDMAALSLSLSSTALVAALQVAPPQEVPPQALVAYMDSGVKFAALRVAEMLRAEGIPTAFLPAAKNLGRQLKECSERGIEWFIVLGGPEWNEGAVLLRHFPTRGEQRLRADAVAAAIRAGAPPST